MSRPVLPTDRQPRADADRIRAHNDPRTAIRRCRCPSHWTRRRRTRPGPTYPRIACPLDARSEGRFAAMTADDWRAPLLDAIQPPRRGGREPDEPPINRLGWPDYTPRNAVRWGRASIGGVETVLAAWDFSVFGGSFGERDASAFLAAVELAVKARRPLVTLVRSGGTRLQEGIAGLVGHAAGHAGGAAAGPGRRPPHLGRGPAHHRRGLGDGREPRRPPRRDLGGRRRLRRPARRRGGDRLAARPGQPQRGVGATPPGWSTSC